MSAHVFISYDRKHKEYVQRLARELQDAGLELWWDSELGAGDEWEAFLKSKVDACGAMVVVLTPDALTSIWVAREIAWARDIDEPKPIIPLLLEGQDLGSLDDLQYEDVRGDWMPSADVIWRLRCHAGVPPRLIEVQSARVNGDRAELVVTFGFRFDFDHAFIDTDLDKWNGFAVPGHPDFGANYMIENSGFWVSTSKDWTWNPIGRVRPTAAYNRGTYHWIIPMSELGEPAVFRVLLHGAQLGGADEVFGPVVTVRRGITALD